MNFRINSLLLCALVAVAPLAHASTLSLDAPVLGFVIDSDTGGVHRIDGFLGSSRLSDPIDLGYPVARASIAPGQRLAIVQNDEGQFLLVDLRATPPTSSVLDGAMEGADGVMFGPAGLVAALYARDTGLFQLVDGIGGTPSVGAENDTLEGLGGFSRFALSDSGAVLVATSGPAGALYLTPRDGQPGRVGGVGEATGLAFLRGSDDAVVADRDANEVMLLGPTGPRTIATANDGLNGPYLAAATADGDFAVVAVPGGVASIPLDGGPVSHSHCGCAPTALDALSGGNVFRLTTDLHAPVQAVEVGREPRVRFIPALAK